MTQIVISLDTWQDLVAKMEQMQAIIDAQQRQLKVYAKCLGDLKYG